MEVSSFISLFSVASEEDRSDVLTAVGGGVLIWHWCNDIMSKGHWFEHCHIVNAYGFSLQV